MTRSTLAPRFLSMSVINDFAESSLDSETLGNVHVNDASVEDAQRLDGVGKGGDVSRRDPSSPTRHTLIVSQSAARVQSACLRWH